MLDNGQAIFRKKHLFFSIDSGFSVCLFMYSYVCKYTVWYLLPHLHIEFFLHVYSAFFFLTVNTTYVVSFSFLRELVKKKKKDIVWNGYYFHFTNKDIKAQVSHSGGFPDISVGKKSTCNAGDPDSIPGSGISAGEGIGYPLQYSWASLVAQLVKNPPAMQETWVRSLDWEDPLEKGKATHSSILGWQFTWTVHGVAKSHCCWN